MSHPEPSLVDVRTLADHPLSDTAWWSAPWLPGRPAQLRRGGRQPSPEEMTAFYAGHDQVMVDV